MLEDEGILPKRVSGSSAGALVGASWAAGVDAPRLAEELLKLERQHFWDPGIGLGLLRGRLFKEKLISIMGTPRFEDTRIPAAVSAFDMKTGQTRVVAAGDIGDAIRASCAVPLLFHPVRIAGRSYLDGGLRDRPGLLGMPSEEERVLFHHIASKSPWRTKQEIPTRAGMTTLAIADLPRSGPFKLEAGRRAFHAAREATKRALDTSIEDGLVLV